MAERVTDPGDPRIAAYLNVRERDLVGRQGKFIAEGEVVLRMLVRSTLCRTLSVLVAENRIEGLADLLKHAAKAAPVYVAEQAVIDSIAGFHLHRGILALGERRDQPSPANLLAALPEEALVVALIGIGNHDNMGGIFRNAAAFGADTVLLSADCCDPLYRKAIRVSVGAVLNVPFARTGEGDDLIDIMEKTGFEVLALSPGGEADLAELTPPRRGAVFFGAEGPGLPEKVLARARTVRIAMATGLDSLNVATASGIVLHHLSRS
jgi:tRNA G18 (ribose-2'-O)-methylase SpoU